MTNDVMDYVGGVLVRYPEIHGSVLEIGSYNVNGSVRPLFADRTRFPSYWGVDMREGPDVDAVVNAHFLLESLDSYGTVVSTEMLEHDDRPWETVRQFHGVLVPGGHTILTTRGIGYPRHDYPSDYWRFTADGLRVLLEYGGFKVLECVDLAGEGVGAVARKV